MKNQEINRKVTECRQRLYDQIQFNVPKGERDRIKAYAEAQGLSMNEYIRRLIVTDMKND